MVHSHNDSCYEEGDTERRECKKGFPKPFRNETQEGDDSYVQYRRRSPTDGGVEVVTRSGRVVNNSMVVPHNLFLLEKYVER